MDLEAWVSRQTELINLESKIEKEQTSDALSSESAVECQARGLSLLGLVVEETTSPDVFSQTVVTLRMKGNRKMPSHKSG